MIYYQDRKGSVQPRMSETIIETFNTCTIGRQIDAVRGGGNDGGSRNSNNNIREAGSNQHNILLVALVSLLSALSATSCNYTNENAEPSY